MGVGVRACPAFLATKGSAAHTEVAPSQTSRNTATVGNVWLERTILRKAWGRNAVTPVLEFRSVKQ